eukprot:CAMPEP_0206462390 /NCGR_PEP_ID=MMETSP0324_2-20121206/25957_1 /ASSEMBLY_ACC=CAM_ASM_000836 /TAXON_ID=2866 /ORGANISM="Crypthecodinium cohnii, Strain Seligo" /LENGTH=62 /DNA_ID=CAMNT_0053934551 /DNA_START=1166 /DNA_END=1350 /DNA_ORIENTATION=-
MPNLKHATFAWAHSEHGAAEDRRDNDVDALQCRDFTHRGTGGDCEQGEGLSGRAREAAGKYP